MSEPQDIEISRNTFIDAENAEYLAVTTTKEMYMGANAETGESVWEMIPQSIKEIGVVPEGYAVDYKLDPRIVAAFFERQGAQYESELDPDMVETMRGVMMAPDNLCIVPVSIWSGKQESITEFLSEISEDSREIKSVREMAAAFFERCED